MKDLSCQKISVSVCFFIIVNFSLACRILRSGFENSYSYEMLLLAGLSLFIIVAPIYINALLEKYAQRRFQESLLSLLLLSLLCVLPSLFELPHFISIIIASTGYLLLIHFSVMSLKSGVRKLPLILNGFLLLFLSSWVVTVVWGGYHLRPTFIESLIASQPYFFNQGYLSSDSLYNISIAQMIKHYGVSSTGLDGLPIIFYHYGSHWTMAQLSRFTGIHLVHLYNFGYPLIFIPLFFYVFIQFSLEVQQTLFKKRETGFLFILILLCLFVQVPKNLYSGGLLGMAGIVNDSFTMSLTIVFALLHGWLLFLRGEQKFSWWFIFISATLIGFAGILKISSGFIMTCLAGFLFFRLRLFKRWQYWIGGIIILLTFCWVYWVAGEYIPFGIRQVTEAEGETNFFHFYRYTHEFEPLSWFLGAYFWLLFLLMLTIIKSYGQASDSTLEIKKMKLFPLEVSVVVALVGVVPSLIMTFSGGNSMYFSGIQIFVSGAFVLGFTPMISERIRILMNRFHPVLSWTTAVLVTVGLLLFMYMEVRSKTEDMFLVNIETRKELLGISVIPGERFSLTNEENMDLLNTRMQEAYDTVRLGKFIGILMEKEASRHDDQLMFINHQTLPLNFFRNMRCIETSFIGPSFSGYAMLDGVSYDCDIGMYGAAYYQRNFRGTMHPSPDQLCKAASAKGFSKVTVFEQPSLHFTDLDCLPR